MSHSSHTPPSTPTKPGRVQLMATCLCDAIYDEVAQATVEVLEHVGCEIDFPEAQTCCGQPAFNSGDWDAARRVIRHTLDTFPGEAPVVLPSGSCAAMCRHGNLLALEKEPDRARAETFAGRVWELADYLVNALGVKQWGGSFKARIALHRSCHLRGSASAEAALTLLRSIEGVEVIPFGEEDQCCGFGGTFSVTFPNVSSRMGALKLDHLREVKPDLIVSLDMSCLMHLGGLAEKQGQPIPTRHLAQVLRDALATGGRAAS
ncbi:(Fe-S)-binding protein [Nibricoccus sp. IMCC34717]|uniref:(Fe-S)-binding protein n=1 Tax=Nibricoccus sp. IMCC34717 TaxID=3034021 RepID=UPI00384A5F68